VNLIYQELEKVIGKYENQMQFQQVVLVILLMIHQYHVMVDFDYVMMVNKDEFEHDQ
jgi:hypothetical protein